MNKKGFTLIEIIAVIIILGILLIITIPLVQNYITSSGKSSMAQTASAYVETVKAEYEMGEYGSLLSEEEIMIVPLEYVELEQGDTEKSKFASYNKDKSYVVISAENNGYEFYVNLVDEAGNGLVMKKTTDLTKENLEEDTTNLVNSWKLYDPDSKTDDSLSSFDLNGTNYSCLEKRNINNEENNEVKISDCVTKNREGISISKGVILLYNDMTKPKCFIELVGDTFDDGVYYGESYAHLIATDDRGSIKEKGLKINDHNKEYNNLTSIPLIEGNNEIYGFIKDDSDNDEMCAKTAKRAYEYNAVYHDNIGANWSNQNVDVSCEGETLKIIPNRPYNTYGNLCVPDKTGYKFVGWSKTQSGETIKNEDIVTDNGNINLYAIWEANTYTITFNGNGATSGSTSKKTCIYDEDCILSPNGFTKTNYGFAGWSKSTTGEIEYTDSQKVKNISDVNTNLDLYAKWSCIDTTKPVVSNINVSLLSANSAKITFSASDTGCSGMKEYVVEFGGQTKTVTTNSVILTGLNNMGIYTPKVTAYDNALNYSSTTGNSLCVPTTFKIDRKTYSVGETLKYLCDEWSVIKNNTDDALLIRTTPMNKSNLDDANVSELGDAIFPTCDNTTCYMSHCAWSQTNPRANMCWIKGNRANSTFDFSQQVDYTWDKSYIRLVINTFLNKNDMLLYAKNANALLKVYGNDYIRVVNNEEVKNDNSYLWREDLKYQSGMKWTMTFLRGDHPDSKKIFEYGWYNIYQCGNNAGLVYPVIDVLKK